MAAQGAERKARFEELINRMTPERRRQVETNRATSEASAAVNLLQARIAEAGERIAALGPIEHALSLEKSWHMLHFLLTGRVDPSGIPGDLLLTGEALGEDLGYGPARLHSNTTTREFSRFIETQDLAALQARVDLEDMSERVVYAMPEGAGPRGVYEDELRNEATRYFLLLRDYVCKMSEKGNGLLVWLS
jgi:hypothetical protein